MPNQALTASVLLELQVMATELDMSGQSAWSGPENVAKLGLCGAGLMLGGDEHRATPLAAERDALQHAQQYEQHGTDPARLRVGRQHADQADSDAHHGDRHDEHGGAANTAAEVPEDDGAERPDNERDANRREGGEVRAYVAEWFGEERPGEERREVGAEIEVVRLERGAYERCPTGSPSDARVGQNSRGTNRLCGRKCDSVPGALFSPGSSRRRDGSQLA